MAGLPDKVLNWLYSVLPSEYADVNRTYSDVVEALSSYPSLSPRTEVYTYENGASALLLLLFGTLPVTFRGATYGFPLAIWVPHAYPRESPIIYITPSQDMLVRPGQHVSGDGRIYHPYLAQWGKYWDKSTIFDFLAVLRGVFAKEPPVRSKQQQYNATTNQPGPPPPPPPVPPTPAEWRQPVQTPPIASPAPVQAPAPPPKPPKPHEQQAQDGMRPSPSRQYDNGQQRPPPLPPHPQQYPANQYGQQQNRWQQQASAVQSIPSRQMSYDTNPPTPIGRHVQAQGSQYETGSPVSPITPDEQGQRPLSRYQQPAPPPQPTQASQQPTNYAQAQPQRQYQYGPPQSNQQQYLNNYPPQQQQQQPPQYMSQPQSQPPPKPKQLIPDLLDSPLDVTLPSQTGSSTPIPAPPIPPNPEKDALLRALSATLVAQLKQSLSENQAAIAPLQAQQSALREAHSRLEAELAQIQQLDAALGSNEQILRDAMVEADRVMEDARRRQVPDVDDVLVAPTVVGGQLYNLCAEERACADALFVLGRALDKGRVGADVFVRQTRALAREMFLKKALGKKIAKGMGLDEYQMR